MNTNLPATIQFENQSLTIVDHDNNPWLSAVDLARALGYANPRAVTGIYTRHAIEFSTGMSEVLKVSTSGNLRKETRIFSPRGCHLVAMFSHTDRAAAFRRWVLDVLEGLAKPAPSVQADPPPVEILPPLNGMITDAGKGLLAGHLLALLNRFGAMPQVVDELERYGQLPIPLETQHQLAVLRMQTQVMAKESARLAQVAEGLADNCLGMRDKPLSHQGRKALADEAIADINRMLDITQA